MFRNLSIPIVAFLLLLACSESHAAGGTQTPPNSQRKLFDEAADYSAGLDGRAILVVQAGEIIYERYDHGWNEDRPHLLASGTKSFTGVVAMFAIQDGLISLDELACKTIHEWQDDPQKSKITIRHLLTLSSGLHPADAAFPTRVEGSQLGRRASGSLVMQRFQRIAERDAVEGLSKLATGDWFADALKVPSKHDAGEYFDYGPSHFYAFGELLERKLATRDDIPQKTFEAYTHAKLLDPLGIQVGRWGKDAAGNVNLPGGMFLTAREWAKFGQFALNHGIVRDASGQEKQLIAPELLDQCFIPSDKNPAYGLTWWLSGVDSEADSGIAGNSSSRPRLDEMRQRMLSREADTGIEYKGQPLTVYMAAGLGKQRLMVIPELDLVVVRFAEPTREGMSFQHHPFLKPIVDAVTGPRHDE